MQPKNNDRFIDPFSNFGFKRIFGSESNKEILIDFLNELLHGQKQLKTLSYPKNEQCDETSNNRKATCDVYCEGDRGEKFFIELQRTKQTNFIDRSLYYATFPIMEEDPNVGLSEIYNINLLDFVFDDNHPDQFVHEAKLMGDGDQVFYDKLTFFYIEIGKFNKSENELSGHLEKWLYLLKDLKKLTEIPEVLQGDIFQKVFQVAEVSNLSPAEMIEYDVTLKDRRDLYNSINTAKQETLYEVAKNLKRTGVDVNVITQSTGLTVEEINAITLD